MQVIHASTLLAWLSRNLAQTTQNFYLLILSLIFQALLNTWYLLGLNHKALVFLLSYLLG